MAKKCTINTRIWDDNWIVRLGPIEKLLFIYLITNPLTGLTGCYEISLRRIAFDTGIDESALKNILPKFIADKRVDYIDGWMIVHNFADHNPFSGEKLEAAKKKEVNQFPDRVSIAYQYPIDTSNSNSNNNSNNNRRSRNAEVAITGKPLGQRFTGYGTKEVNQVLNYFEQTMQIRLRRIKAQREAAHRLLRDEGLKRIIGAINIASACKGRDKKPQVYNVEDVEQKWAMLERHGGKALAERANDDQRRQIINKRRAERERAT